MRLFSKHVDNRLSEYIDGRLAPAEAARVEAHLSVCAGCDARLAGLRQAIEALQSLPEVDAPRSFAINEAMVRPVTAYKAPRWQTYAAPAAGMAVVFVLLLGGDLATSIDSEDDEDVADQASEELIQTDALASEQEATLFDEDDSAAADGGAVPSEEQEEAGETDSAPADESSTERDTPAEGGADAEPEEAAPAAPPDDETIERLENIDDDDDDFRLFVRLIEAGLAISALGLGLVAFLRWRAAR